MHVALVAGVPQDGVGGALEDAVQGDGEFHRAEVAAQVTAGVGHGIHDELANFLGQGLQLWCGQAAQICGGLDTVKLGHSGSNATP